MSTEPANVSKGPPADVNVRVSGRLPMEPPFKLPPPAPAMFATFTLDSLGISNTRSLHNDTDLACISATVGANPALRS